MVIAGRVLSAGHGHHIALHLLRAVSDDVSFTLLRHNTPNITFLGLDVIGDLARLITLFAFREHRSAFPLVVEAVVHPARINEAAVHVHADILGFEFHGLIFEVAVSVQKRCSVAQHDHRIAGLVMYRTIQRTPLPPHCRRAEQEYRHYHMYALAYVHNTAI